MFVCLGMVLTSPRGVGWNIRASQMPNAPSKEISRSRWVVSNAIRLVLMYLGADLTSTILIYLGRGEPFLDQPILWQVCVSWVKAFRSYYSIEITYYIIAILAVGFGISTPQVSGQYTLCTVPSPLPS